ncbi:hypothetical protein ACFXHA_39950 [Nocardia sp. NPDC059240]|uniref:hypothetical protein n=1 Tax=Nocardia sp. NPDC059240 TaxID=3346786 RepID=UPI00369FCDF0
MGGEPGADLYAVAEIAIAATQFEWTWTAADAERFAEHLGWGAASVQREERGPALVAERLQREGRVPRHVELYARLNPASLTLSHDGAPRIRLSTLHDEVRGIAIVVPTIESGSGPDTFDLTFEELGVLFRAAWGEPTGVSPGTPQLWVHPRIVVNLSTSGGETFLTLDNPAVYRSTRRSAVAAADKAVRLTDWSAFLAAIPLVAQADTGSWSRADITRLTRSTGWPTVELDGLLRDHLRVELESDREWIFLDAAKTPDDPDLARSGFGEFSTLLLMQRLSTAAGDAAYRAALAECVRLLGVPTRVGGLGARAIWRQPDVTITLRRSTGNLTLLYLQVDPTAATEDYQRRVLDTDTDTDRIHGNWVAAPDAASDHYDDRESPDVELGATTWTAFKSCLQPVFESLAADVALLHPYVGRVEWTIGRRDDPDGWLVRGWFGDSGSRLEILGTDGQSRPADYLPGRPSGRDIAIAVLTALREQELGSPAQLWCDADIPTKPQRLLSFRLGLNHRE